ncbi:hypothetical protein [Propionigenium maris]|uniref:hypothetical protein n=1 Tax=Propionigenium maris TaxID=45622 RepID=UPI002491A076|nr:hypothetical protein [Propionigenium maris]
MNKRKLKKLINNYPVISVEPIGDMLRVVEFDREFQGSRRYCINNSEILKKKKVLLNLGEKILEYKFIRVEGTKKSPKRIRDEVVWQAQAALNGRRNLAFSLKRISRDTYLVFYYSCEKIEELMANFRREETLIFPEILGTYNYWVYFQKKKMRKKNAVLIQMKGSKTVVIFVREGVLANIRTFNLGIESYREKSEQLHIPASLGDREKAEVFNRFRGVNLRWMKEVKHSIFNSFMADLTDTEVFLLGHENTIVNLDKLLESYLEVDIHPSPLEATDLSYVNLIGNLLAHRGKKHRRISQDSFFSLNSLFGRGEVRSSLKPKKSWDSIK